MLYLFRIKDGSPRVQRVGPGAGGETPLDFTRPFLPESLAGGGDLDFLGPAEARTLNQIRAHTYLAVFGLFGPRHAQRRRVFGAAFEAGPIGPCVVIGSAAAIRANLFARPPLSMALWALMIAGMSQRHYTEDVEYELVLDPFLEGLLRRRSAEAAEDVQRETVRTAWMAETMPAWAIDGAIDAFLALAEDLDAMLVDQAALDIEALERATGRAFTDPQHDALMAAQLSANRWTFLGSGLSHPKLLATIDGLSGRGRRAVELAALGFQWRAGQASRNVGPMNLRPSRSVTRREAVLSLAHP